MKPITLPTGKSVLASDTYTPGEAMLSNFVGRQHELRLITAAWISSGRLPPLSPLLVGEPGVGKNRLVYELSRQSGLPLYIMQGHEDITAEDLACSVRFRDGLAGGMEYVLSPLVTAMFTGGIAFIDEIGKVRPRALALLVSVLDERRYIDSTLLGERVYARPEFRFIAATNTGEVNGLPEFIRSRLRPVIQVGFPPKEEINEIISRYTTTETDLGVLLDAFWALWVEAKHPPTPRDTIHLFALASNLSDLERNEKRSSSNGRQGQLVTSFSDTTGSFSMEPRHLQEAFGRLFGGEAP